MFRRILAVATMLCALPALANATKINVTIWAKSGGGNITVENALPNKVKLTSAYGQTFGSYSTAGGEPAELTITPNPGYSVTPVINTCAGAIAAGYVASTVNCSATGLSKDNVEVMFSYAPQAATITASAGAGGSVNMTKLSNIFVGQKLVSAATFKFIPSAGYKVTGVAGVPAGAYTNPTSLPAAVGQTVSVTFPAGYTITSAPVNLVGSFATTAPIANAGAPQTIVGTTTATLDGSASINGTSYLWTQISGPATATIASPSSATTAVSGLTASGVYGFKLTVNGTAYKTTSITVTDSATNAATTQCVDCHAANGIGGGYTSNGVYANWSTGSHGTIATLCSSCHVGANTGGHPGTVNAHTVSPTTYTLTGPANGYPVGSNFCAQCHSTADQNVSDFNASVHATSGPATCSGCHGDVHMANATISPCVECHVGSDGNVPGHPITIGTKSCLDCHNPHSAVAKGCDGCHDSPPATASHQKHFGGTLAQAGYGDTRIAKDFGANATSYTMGCGNCHPMDQTKHNNGLVEVELYNPNAPVGSLKGLNPATAVYVADTMVLTDNKGFPYTKGTCSNVYCHSYNEWTTTSAVPLGDPDWQSKVATTRIYKDVTWEGASLTCSGCHANPPRSSYPANDGGAGNSHSWIDPYGYENMHNFNMGFAPVSCSYCHIDTVTQQNTFTRDGMGVATLSDVPISNFAKHVNGFNDVSFDTPRPFSYNTSSGNVSMGLANATYDPNTKSCSNVSCHINQTSVKWGTPYRWYTNECSPCHGY